MLPVYSSFSALAEPKLLVLLAQGCLACNANATFAIGVWWVGVAFGQLAIHTQTGRESAVYNRPESAECLARPISPSRQLPLRLPELCLSGGWVWTVGGGNQQKNAPVCFSANGDWTPSHLAAL